MNHDTIKNEAIQAGYPEELAEIIATVVMGRLERGEGAEYILNYPAFRPGSFSAQVGGDIEITTAEVEKTSEAVNKLYQLGQPVALIDGHNSSDALGVIPASYVDADSVMRAALIGDWYALDGILNGTSGLSIEAIRNYSSDAYTDGEEYPFWPTAWAVLPAGQQPAIPPGEPIAAADDNDKPVRLYAHEQSPERGVDPHGKGDAEMTDLEKRIEALEAKQTENESEISTLKAENGELKGKLEAAEKERDELKQAKEAAEVEAAEKAVEAKLEEVLAKKLPGKREQFKADVMAAEGAEARLSMIELLDRNVPDMSADEQVLHAAESGPEGKDEGDKLLEAAEARAKSDHISFGDALALVSEELE